MPDRRSVLVSRLLTWALALGLGCACDDAPRPLCTQPGLGSGPCCALLLPDGRSLAGACVDGRCQHAAQPGVDGPCDDEPGSDATPVLADAGPRDADSLGDAAPDARPDDGEPGDARDMGSVDDGRHDGAVPSCRQVVCEPDERCEPETGRCRSIHDGVPGGACRADGECDRGRCLSEAESEGAVPGGFCSVDCADDGDCGAGHCLETDEGRVCFEGCDDRGACRMGWICAEPAGLPGCRVDCRVAGCPGQGRCERETGLCRPAEVPCRYRCAVGESCEQSRCVRVDGTCVTDYHCPLDGRCLDGRCVAAEYSPCAEDEACGVGQRCVALDGGGVCLARCAADADCPVDRACRPELGACDITVCGPGTDNGSTLGPCAFGTQRAQPGTCLPAERPGGGAGACVEAGLAEPGEPCDAQVDGRAPADRALRCAPGAVCHGDPDDPLHPERAWAGRGRCAALCVPGGPCVEGECVDFGVADDPETPGDESVVLGLCLDVQCRVLAPRSCPAGERCRPFALSDDAGRCGAAGRSGAGQPCETADDCVEVALCVSRGAGTECLSVCDPARPDSCPGGLCYSEPGWGFGVCL